MFKTGKGNSMGVLTGLDVLQKEDFSLLRGKSIGVLCHQATINSRYQHLIDLLLPLHKRGDLQITAVYGPQHGLWGHTQDNMIEWEGYRDERTGLMIYSLYGKHRKPTPEMLRNVELMVVDMQDVGARYYTFIWTLALTMEACQEEGIPVMVLDRPNPIGGKHFEGTLLNPEYASFVGLHPIAQRHGFTMGEIAHYFRNTFYNSVDLQVIRMEGWKREFHFPETGLPWAMPSPNIPVYDTALVYPGMCLLEATNLSEGRGTTRPFEIFGAPWLDGWKLAESLNQLQLPGVYFRPIQFMPTFHKHANQICEGCFIHVTDRETFRPVRTTLALLQEVIRQQPEKFQWKNPPYEYEFEKLPIEILLGNGWLHRWIEELRPLSEIEERLREEETQYEKIRKEHLLYQ